MGNILLKRAIADMDLEAVRREVQNNADWVIDEPWRDMRSFAQKRYETQTALVYWFQARESWLNNRAIQERKDICVRATACGNKPSIKECEQYMFAIFQTLLSAGAPWLVDSIQNPLKLALDAQHERVVLALLRHDKMCAVQYSILSEQERARSKLFGTRNVWLGLSGWTQQQRQRVAQEIVKTQSVDWLSLQPLFGQETPILFLAAMGAIQEVVDFVINGAVFHGVVEAGGWYGLMASYGNKTALRRLRKHGVPVTDGDWEVVLKKVLKDNNKLTLKNVVDCMFNQEEWLPLVKVKRAIQHLGLVFGRKDVSANVDYILGRVSPDCLSEIMLERSGSVNGKFVDYVNSQIEQRILLQSARGDVSLKRMRRI